jgi:hypothetical protein
MFPRSSTFFEKFVVEPPTGIERTVQSCRSGCIGIRPVLVGNDHLLLHLRVNILFQRIKSYYLLFLQPRSQILRPTPGTPGRRDSILTNP